MFYRWVQKYIRNYGGDPDQVTVMGMSAGGASIHYHMLSPLSRGLFKNAISFSGSSLNWWAHIPHPRKNALKLAKILNCDTTKDSKDMLECLRTVPSDKLGDAHNQFFDWRASGHEREPMNVFSPRFELFLLNC